MGTNFYTLKGVHIGKRSAAGLYCWDCNITLCKGENSEIHKGVNGTPNCPYGDPIFNPRTCGWYDICPKCGKKPQEETFENGAVGRELGFNRSKPQKKIGVASCSSFSWAINPASNEADKLFKSKTGKSIKNEYGDKFTVKEFFKVLEECPIQYDMVGQEFS